MSKQIFMLCQYLLPQFLLTRFAGWMASRRSVFLKNWLINDFIQRYQVDLSIAAVPEIEKYACFNDFFTRALAPSTRPIHSGKDVLVSPVDGSISQIGRIEKDTLLQAKGAYFNLQTLLGGQQTDAARFENGHYATLYLSPKDYHRVHIPFAGKLIRSIYIPGKLFSVNPLAVENIPQLFARNERLVCLFETSKGPMAVILVGAMLVGKIQTVWGLIERGKQVVVRDYLETESLEFNKGDELGRFLMGSSVVLLFGEGMAQWLPGLEAQDTVRMGESIGCLTSLPHH